MNKERNNQPLPKKRIGIIGGLGPRASAHFFRLIIDQCTKKFEAAQDSDYPSIILYNVSSFGLPETGIADQAALFSDLNEAFECFSKAGVDVIAIACNSIFAFYGKMLEQTKIHIINLPYEVAFFLSTRSIKSVSILGSRGIVKSKIYDSHFNKMNIISRYPDQTTQEKIDAWIFDVMRGHYNDQTISELQKVIEEQLKLSNAVLIACSELSVLVNPFYLPENIFDSMFILADCTLELAMS